MTESFRKGRLATSSRVGRFAYARTDFESRKYKFVEGKLARNL